ncbi:calmodulin-dependent protein kinase [Gigaspora margarita]|nr:calmodulin-dependent protein kinase [Gigaspora margarita]
MLIADFGISKHLNEVTMFKATEMYGYLEPQCFANHKHKCNEKSDIYSLGVIFWEITSGQPPFNRFEHKEAIIVHVHEGKRETPVENTPNDYVELYQRCWDQDPEKRPEIKTVLEKLKDMRLLLIDDQKSLNERWIESKVIEGKINEYKIGEFNECKLINAGNSSKVYRARIKNTGNICALKVIEKNVHTNKEIINELDYMISVESHENIIKFHGITYTADEMDENVVKYVLILEYADNGTLRDYLQKNSSKIECELKIQFAIQLVEAVKWLHTHKIVHGDLHPNNILIHGETLKLADFGLSRRVIEASRSQTTNEVFGVVPFIDPQCFTAKQSQDGTFRRLKNNMKSDIYSIGVILWEISSEKQPFKNEDTAALLPRIKDGLREKPIVDTNPEYVAIYQRCWQGMQNDRPSIEEVATALEDIIVQDITIDDSFEIFDSSGFEEFITKTFKNINEKIKLNATAEMTLFVNNLYSAFRKLFNESESVSDIITNFISKSGKTNEEVFKWLLENKNHSKYICLLGLFHWWNIGTDEKNEAIFDLFDEAANKGDAIAQYFVGRCYAGGWNIGKNRRKAIECYTKAAENGCTAADRVL